jgi:hypothetical protein
MANTYVKIATATAPLLGSASFDFTSIPATYTDLIVKFSIRELTGTSYTCGIRFNGSTTTYTRIDIRGNGAAASSGSATNIEPIVNSSGATASTFGNGEIYIPNYAGSTNKSSSVDSVSENNATTAIMRMSATLWSTTSAINQITFVPDSGNFAQYSTATLYGISKS